MDAAVEYEKFGFSLDMSGDEIETLGWDLDELMEEESPLGTIEEVWDDAALRRAYPDAMDKMGDIEVAVILGRLTRLFGAVTLDKDEVEGVGFRAPLVVTRLEDDKAVAAAVCYERNGVAYLCAVATDEEDEDLVEEVAREFWRMLLDELDDLEDEDVLVYSPDEDVWFHYGVAEGAEPFVRQQDEPTDELDELEGDTEPEDNYDEESEY